MPTEKKPACADLFPVRNNPAFSLPPKPQASQTAHAEVVAFRAE